LQVGNSGLLLLRHLGQHHQGVGHGHAVAADGDRVAVPNWPLASMTTGKPPLTVVPRIPAMKVWFWPFVPSNGKPIRIVFVSEDKPYTFAPIREGHGRHAVAIPDNSIVVIA
jgi:hypothetical protein